MLTRPARLHGAASRSVVRGLRLLACQLLVQAGVAAPQDEGSRRLVPAMARRVTNVNTTKALVAAVKDESVGTIVVAAGTYKLTSKMSGAVCGDGWGDSALCIGRNLTIRAESNGTVVLDATKQTWRVIYVGKGGRVELVGLNITGGKAAVSVRSLFEPAGNCSPAPCRSARFLLSGWRSTHRWWQGISYLLYDRGQPGQLLCECLPFQPPKPFFQCPARVLAFCSQGGGLFINGGGEAFLTSCTIAGNQAEQVSACLLNLRKPSFSALLECSLSALRVVAVYSSILVARHLLSPVPSRATRPMR